MGKIYILFLIFFLICITSNSIEISFFDIYNQNVNHVEIFADSTKYYTNESNSINLNIKKDTLIFIKRYGYIGKKVKIRPNEEKINIILKPNPNLFSKSIIITSENNKNNFSNNIIDFKENKFSFIDSKELLSQISGTYISGNSFGKANLSIWGSTSQQVNILLNGMKINKISDNRADLSLINPENIEKIEISKGVQLGENGDNNIGGTINIITKKNCQKFSSTVKISNEKNYYFYNTLNLYNTNLSSKLELLNKNFKYYNFLTNKIEERKNEKENNFSINLEKNFKFNNNLFNIFCLYNYNFSKYPNTYNYGNYFDKAYIKSSNYILNNEYKFIQNKYYLAFYLNYFYLYQKYIDEKHTYYNNTGIENRYEIINKNYLSIFSLNFDFGEKFFFDKFYNSSGTLKDKIERKYIFYYKVSKDINILGNHTFSYGNNFTSINNLNNFYKSYLLSYNFEKNLFNCGIEFGNGYRFPTLSEKHWQGAQVTGNIDLKPEIGKNLKFKIGILSSDYNFSVSAFYLELKNYIIWSQSAMGFWKPINCKDKIIKKGLDFNAYQKFVVNQDWNFSFFITSTLINAKNLRTKNKLRYTPDLIYNIETSLEKNKKFGIKITEKFVDDRYPTDDRKVQLIDGLRGLKKYYQTNISFWYNFGCIKGVRLNLDLNNIFNKYFEEFEKYPNSAFNYFISINYSI